MVAVIESSDPAVKAVVPHGGLKPFITPNPIAAGLPTSAYLLLIDVSTSITSMGFAFQEHAAGRKLPGEWLIDHLGNATRDGAALANEPKGALLPLGGIDAGHKGFALGLLIEAMTGGLAGHGRADPPEGWGATVFVQVLDPEAFGGLDAFKRQMDFVVTAAHGTPVRSGSEPVRLPGERGLQRYREQVAKGIALYPSIMPTLAPWAEKLGAALPSPHVGTYATRPSADAEYPPPDRGATLRRETRLRAECLHALCLIVAMLEHQPACDADMRACATRSCE